MSVLSNKLKSLFSFLVCGAIGLSPENNVLQIVLKLEDCFQLFNLLKSASNLRKFSVSCF